MPHSIRRRRRSSNACIFLLGLLMVLFLYPGSIFAQLTTQPNIVFILVDNWGWGDVGIQGSAIPTPMIDGLAREGIRFTNYNVENQCTPTRSAIHTGRLPIRSGTHRVTYGMPYGMASWEYTIAELLSDAGYETALYGKWHLGDSEGRLPTDQGYDEWFGIKNAADEAGYTSTPQFDLAVFPEPYIWEGKRGEAAAQVMPFDLESRSRIDRMIVERSNDYIKMHAASEKPFFLYIGLTDFSPPLAVHPYFEGKSGSGIYSDTLVQLDHHIGMILQAVNDAGFEEDTIVILTGDNGTDPSIGGGGSNGPFRGGFTGYEGGLRTVGMMRWPGKIKSGKVTDQIVASLDWLPTLAGLAGEQARIPTDRPIDGIDQSAFLLGNQEISDREHVIYYIGAEIFSFKWRNFKIHMQTVDNLLSPVQRYLFPLVYDVKNDPGERVELMRKEGFSHAWVLTPMQKILGGKATSMREYPNIEPGEAFKGYVKE